MEDSHHIQSHLHYEISISDIPVSNPDHGSNRRLIIPHYCPLLLLVGDLNVVVENISMWWVWRGPYQFVFTDRLKECHFSCN